MFDDLVDGDIREAEEEALPFIFLRIIEFFGHKNPYICTVAYIEVSLMF